MEDKSGVCTNKQLPKNKRFACVEFPCVVSECEESRKKAVKMLGGEGAITAALEGKSKFMELRFRPDSVFAHPAFGERHTTPSLLLHVVAKEGPDGPVVKEAEFKGVIESTFQFNGLCDFQFLKDPEQSGDLKKESRDYSWNEDARKEENNPETESEARLNQNESLFIPPALFSRADMPWEYEFKPNKVPRKKETSKSNSLTGNDSTSKDNITDKESATIQRGSENTIKPIMYVSLNDLGDRPLPSKPPEKTIPIAEENICLIEPIKNLFSERPIWTAMALVDRIRSSSPAIYKKISAGGWESTLKRICAIATNFAYRFISGPWRSTFVRYGFDPRKDSTSAAYQIFDLRFGKQQAGDKGGDAGASQAATQLGSPSMSSGDTADERKRGLVNHPHRKKNFVYDLEDFTLNGSERSTDNDGESGQNDTVTDRVSEVLDGFKLIRAPNTLQRTYCIADVFNEYIEGIVKEVLGGKFRDRTFNTRSKFGWFTKTEFKSIILTLKKMAMVLWAEPATKIDETSPSYKVKITPEMVPKQKDHHKNRAIRPPEVSPRKTKKRKIVVGDDVKVEGMSQDQKDKIIEGLLKKIAVDVDGKGEGSAGDGEGSGTQSGASKRKEGKDAEGEEEEEEEEEDIEIDDDEEDDNDDDDDDDDEEEDDDEMYHVFEEEDEGNEGNDGKDGKEK